MSEASSLVNKKIGLDEMWDALAHTAWEIEISQGAAVLAGLMSQKNPIVMRRVRALENAALLIQIVKEVEPEFRALVARKRGWTNRNQRSAE